MAAGGNSLGYRKDSSGNSWARSASAGQQDEFGDTPQRPPTVGQELPNNLYQSRPRSKRVPNKKGMSEKNSVQVGQLRSSADRTQKANPEPRQMYSQMSSRHQKESSGGRKSERTHDNDAEELDCEIESRYRNVQSNTHNQREDSLRYPESAQSRHGSTEDNSRRGPSSAASSTDMNTVMARLLEIQEYIRRVSSSIETMEKARDKRAMESLPRLYSVRDDLVENEKHLLRLLEKLTACAYQSKSSDRKFEPDSNGIHDDTVVQRQKRIVKEAPNADTNGEAVLADALAKRNELLQKVAMSHEKLQALQDQQTMLMALKEKAAQDALNARATVEDLRRKTAAIVVDFQRENTPPISAHAVQQSSAIAANDMGSSTALQKDLDDLKIRLKTLHNKCDGNKDMKLPARTSDNTKQGFLEQFSRDENCDDENVDVISARRDLENGTNELEQKKQKMDDLIQELHNLRLVEMQRSGLSENSDLSQKESIAANAQKMLADAQKDLQSLDTTNKLMRLTEMQQRLHALQEMVDNLDPAEESAIQAEAKEVFRNCNFPRTRTSGVLNTRNAPAMVPCLNSNDNMPKADNLHRVHVQDKAALLHSADAVDIGKRFKKLQSTKSKLQKLQDALAMVQQSDPNDRNEAVECAEQLLASLDEYPGDDCSEYDEPDPRNGRTHLRSEEIVDPREIRQMQDHQLEADLVNFSWHAKSAEGRPPVTSRTSRSPRPTKDTLNRDHDNISRPVVPTSQVRSWTSRGDDTSMGGRGDRGDWNGSAQPAGLTGMTDMVNGGGCGGCVSVPSESAATRCNSCEAWQGLSKADDALLAVVEGTSAATWGSSSQDLEEHADSQDDDAAENEAYSSEEPAEGAEEDEEDEELAENVRFAGARTSEAVRKCGVCGSCLEAECPIPERCRENNSVRQRPNMNKRNKAPVGAAWPTATSTPATPSQKANTQRVVPNNANVNKTPPSSVPSAEFDGVGEDRSLPSFPQSRSHLQQQMETTSQLCQSLMQDNALMNSLLQNHIPVAMGNCGVSVRPPTPDILHLYSTQLLLSLVHCHQLAFLHQLFAQQAVGACTPVPTPTSDEVVQQHQMSQRNQRPAAVLGNGCPPVLPDFCVGEDMSAGPWTVPVPPATQQLHLQQPAISQANSAVQQQHQLFSRHIQAQPAAAATNVPETLNNQVPPGTRANNYWDNFRSYSRQNLFSAASCNKSNEFAMPPSCPNNQRGQPIAVTPPTFSVHHAPGASLPAGSPAPTFPPVHLPMPFTTCKLTDGWTLDPQHLLMATTSLTSGLTVSTADSFGGARGADAGGPTPENVPTLSQPPPDHHHPVARERAKDKSVNEHAGTRSNVFPRLDCAASRVADQRGSGSKLHAKASLPKQGKDASKRLRPTLQSDPNREAIDAAVSTLVAQNESEPQLLLSLLRGLSLLDSRQMRDRALTALRDVAFWEDVAPAHSTSHKIAPEKKELVNLEEPDFPKNGGREEVFFRHLSWDERADFESKSGEGGNALGLFQDDGNVARGTSRELSEQQNRPVDVRRLDAQIDAVLQEIAPMLRGRPTDLCTPKLLSRISQRVIDCLAPQIEHHQSSLSEPHSRDSRFFYKQLSALLDEVVMKYTGMRIVECANVLLMELSEVFSKELAFMFVSQNAEVQSSRPRARSQRHSQESSIAESASSLMPPASIEITDADLVLMAKREELDDRDRGFISPSCDIPDVARRETLDIVEGVAACAPRISGTDHLCGDECGKFLEAEAEGEEVGDNRDLAEADQSHDYLDDDEDHQGHASLDDGEEGQGDKERTEDDLGERSEPAGAAAINAAAANQASASLLRIEGEVDEADAIAMASEMVLDEVPTKLRGDPAHRSGSEGGEVSPEAKRSDSDGAAGGAVGGPGPSAPSGSSAGQGLGNKMFSGE